MGSTNSTYSSEQSMPGALELDFADNYVSHFIQAAKETLQDNPQLCEYLDRSMGGIFHVLSYELSFANLAVEKKQQALVKQYIFHHFITECCKVAAKQRENSVVPDKAIFSARDQVLRDWKKASKEFFGSHHHQFRQFVASHFSEVDCTVRLKDHSLIHQFFKMSLTIGSNIPNETAQFESPFKNNKYAVRVLFVPRFQAQSFKAKAAGWWFSGQAGNNHLMLQVGGHLVHWTNNSLVEIRPFCYEFPGCAARIPPTEKDEDSYISEDQFAELAKVITKWNTEKEIDIQRTDRNCQGFVEDCLKAINMEAGWKQLKKRNNPLAWTISGLISGDITAENLSTMKLDMKSQLPLNNWGNIKLAIEYYNEQKDPHSDKTQTEALRKVIMFTLRLVQIHNINQPDDECFYYRDDLSLQDKPVDTPLKVITLVGKQIS